MQIVLDVMARAKFQGSLRELIITDLKKWEYLLDVVSEKKSGRRSGWAKISAKDIPGVINIFWHASSKTLLARVVTKRGKSSSDLVGRFVSYLLERRSRDVIGITIRTL